MSLCQACGLCCDGTMYLNASLTKTDNLERLNELGIKPIPEGDKHYFNQPCPAFRLHQCSIYEERPTTCQKYRCALLKRHDAGDISSEKALSLIRDMIELRDSVRHSVEHFLGIEGCFSLPALFGLMVDKLKTDQDRFTNPQMQLDVGMLRVLLSRHFEPQDTKLAVSAKEETSQ